MVQCAMWAGHNTVSKSIAKGIVFMLHKYSIMCAACSLLALLHFLFVSYCTFLP
jgi:hypothetical protein